MKCIKVLQNTEITQEDLNSLLSQTQAFLSTGSYVYGKQVIPKGDRFVLFYRCEYCGGQDVKEGLYGMTVCCSCGAAI